MTNNAVYTLTLEKALTDAFVLVLQQEMQGALTVTASENSENMKLPACFVLCTRRRESIINSAIFEFGVDLSLIVQADDYDAIGMENLWANLLCVAYDIEGLKQKLNSISPLYAYIFGILRDSGVSISRSDRHFVRTATLTIHCGLLAAS
jgi:hypothetical protein